ncbi:hypothetical protein PG987_012850 [Apiospora arundinis]
MSGNLYNIDLDALFDLGADPVTHLTEPDAAQVNAADEHLKVDGSLSPWVSGDPHEIHPDPSQAPGSTYTEGFDWYRAAHEAQFGWNTNTGTYGTQSALGQSSALNSQYEGFDYGSTLFGANDTTLFDSINTFTIGTNPGVFHYEPGLPVSSVGSAFSTNNNRNTFGTITSPLIGQGSHLTSLPCCCLMQASTPPPITHEIRDHAPGHSQVEPNGSRSCAECGQAFKSRNQQQSHGHNSRHNPFQCLCGVKFCRIDVLRRHIDCHAKDVPKFPCKFCKFHRGKLGFRRRDHLVQHLHGYHKLDHEEIAKACPNTRFIQKDDFATCPHQGCDSFRGDSFHNLPWSEQLAQKPFPTQAAFTKHMKEVHRDTPFPCDVNGCDRVGSRGYIREKDFMKHRATKHPEAPKYNPKQRPS